MQPGSYQLQFFFLFLKNPLKNGSEEVWMLILTYFPSFNIRSLFKKTSFSIEVMHNSL